MFRKYIRFSWDIQNKPHQNIPCKSPACSVSIAQSVETAIHTFLRHVRHFDTSVSTPFHGRRHYLPLTLIHFSFSLSNQENTPSRCLLPNAICTMPGCIDRNSENWLSSRKLYAGMIWHESVWCGSGPEWCGVENLDWFLCDSGCVWPFPWLDSKETCDDSTGPNPSMRYRRNFGHWRDPKTSREDPSISRILNGIWETEV